MTSLLQGCLWSAQIPTDYRETPGVPNRTDYRETPWNAQLHRLP